MLPILTFDEGTLAPSFGYVFAERWIEPYESVVGILWKFARANALPGHLLIKHLTAVTVDPYEGIDAEPSSVNIRRLAKVLGIKQRTVAVGLPNRNQRRVYSSVLRTCERCIYAGYHGVVHQFLGSTRCPIHGDRLQELCRHCAQQTPYRLNAQLLDAPFRCAQCRRRFANCSWSPATHRPLPPSARTAATRAFLGY